MQEQPLLNNGYANKHVSTPITEYNSNEGGIFYAFLADILLAGPVSYEQDEPSTWV
jgi:hypothetical protein